MASKQHDEGSTQALSGSLKNAVALVERMAKATRADFDVLKREAADLRDLLHARRRSARESRGRGRDRERLRAVDEWILDIFRSTESAVPRETLFAEFVARYRTERRVMDTAQHDGPWLFAFELAPSDDGQMSLLPKASAGVHPQAFAALCAEHLPNAASDPFLSVVMHERNDIHGWHAAWFEGSPLFDRLLDIRQRFDGESDYWVSAIALQGDDSNDLQGLFVLHANTGDVLTPEPPSTLRQDLRVLLALSSAWRQLGHQVRTLAILTERDRRELLNLIAPGLLHHEVGTTLRTLYGQAYELFHLLQQQAAEEPGPRHEAAVRYSHGIGTLAIRAQNITNVFNNLDKRGLIASADLNQVMSDVQTLLHHRLGAASTHLQWDAVAFGREHCTTDVVLLQQALINIVINALNAIVEAESPPARGILVRLEATTPELLAVSISNTGPPVEAQHARDIFRRGYTTRQEGHGQGLYLVRLIAHYLRGEVDLMQRNALPEGHNVGFRLQWSRVLSAQEGLARAIAE